jgi:restriction system protein
MSIRKSGGYRKLASFQTSTLIYDATVWFCQEFVDSRSRTCDQMVQAARSGRQNIAEGSRASATSSQTELKLVNVARASLEELLLDFEDFLRHRHLPLWDANHPEACAVRRVPRRFRQDRSDRSDRSDQTNPPYRSDMTILTDAERWKLYSHWLEHNEPTVRANAIVCLIHQCNFLLDQQISALEHQFITGGGYQERLAAERLAHRAKVKSLPDVSVAADPTSQIPDCPRCGKPMSLRTAKQGKNAGCEFWGCTGYPDCKGIVKV